MAEVTVRELRNRGGHVLDRVESGESLTVTRSGRPVAELRPLRNPGLTAVELLRRRRRLPGVDLATLRGDLDSIVDPRL